MLQEQDFGVGFVGLGGGAVFLRRASNVDVDGANTTGGWTCVLSVLGKHPGGRASLFYI